MNIVKFKGKAPHIESDAYISQGVYIIGDVTIGSGSNIWFGSILRGDVAPIIIGKNSNIQDGTVIHTSSKPIPTHIGDDVTVGHRAILHACTLKNHAFIGMGATVMDGAIVEEYGFVAAGALIGPGKVVGSKQLWAGVPAKYIRDLREEEIEHIKKSAVHYIRLAGEYK